MNKIVLLLLIGLVGCAPKTYTPAMKALYNKDALVNEIGLIQSAAIQMRATNQMSTNDTRTIVSVCNRALGAIRASLDGWKEAVMSVMNDLLSDPKFKKFQIDILTVQNILSVIK